MEWDWQIRSFLLFIYSRSFPAFCNRCKKAKGRYNIQLVQHVLLRSVCIDCNGRFPGQRRVDQCGSHGYSRLAYNTICCICFILIWNRYPKTWNAYITNGLKGIAILTLMIIAYLYQGGPDDKIELFTTLVGGILGLIGWAYLASGLITIYSRKQSVHYCWSLGIFAILSMLHHAHMIPSLISFIPEPIRGGTLTGLTMGGVLTALIFKYYRERKMVNPC